MPTNSTLLALRNSALYAPVRRWRLDKLTKREDAYPDWGKLLDGHAERWQEARQNADGPRVAIATSLGLNFTVNTIDSLIAVALTLRGARVDFIYCDGALPACQVLDHKIVPNIQRLIERGPQFDFCDICTGAAERCVSPLGLNVIRFSEYIGSADKVAAKAFAKVHKATIDFSEPDARLEHARAGALRFFGKATLNETLADSEIYARYLEAAYLTDVAARKIFIPEQYHVVLAHHGIYVPQGPIAHVIKESSTRLVTWHPSYRNKRLIYQHDDTYHKKMISEPVETWDSTILTDQENADLDEYLISRETGKKDWITFQRKAPELEKTLVSELGLDEDKKLTLLAANVAWDARLHYPKSAFGDMIEWTIETVKWFEKNPDQELVIRCHPGEVMSQPVAQDRLDDAIHKAFPNLPENVTIIPPEMITNTYVLARLARRVVIFNTKLGMELAARGQSVIVAGDAWIRGKGFSHDADSAQSYIKLLDSEETFKPLTPTLTAKAKRYAYHFFFRRCIPVKVLEKKNGWSLTSLTGNSMEMSYPGRDPGLDVICDGILNGSSFEFNLANNPSK